MADFTPVSKYFSIFYQHKTSQISNVKVDICSLGLSSKVYYKISWNFRETFAKFRSKMAETGDEDFSGTRIVWGSRYTSKFL